MASLNAYPWERWMQLTDCQVSYDLEMNAYIFIDTHGNRYKLTAEHIDNMSSAQMDLFTRNPFNYLKFHAYAIEIKDAKETEDAPIKKSSNPKIRKIML